MSTSPSKPHIFNPENHPAIFPTFSQISTVTLSPSTTLVTLAGQIGVSPASTSTPTTFLTQVRAALSNVDICLSAAGATKADIIAVRQYVVGLGSLSEEDRKARADVYLEWLGGLTPPPSTLVGVECLAQSEMLYEIEVQAVVVRK